MLRLLRRALFNSSLFFAILITLLFVSLCAFAPDAISVLGAVTQSTPARPPALAPTGVTAIGCVYQVRPGDNLFRIGLRYGVSFRYLASLNGIPNPNLIFAGTRIAVPCSFNPQPIPLPANCGPSQAYIVQPGNNLFRIALAYGSRVEWIQATNNLYGRVLRPNMNLQVPCPGSVQYRAVPEPPAGVATVAPPGEQPPVEVPPTTQPAAPPTQNPVSPPLSNSVTVKIFADHFEPDTLTIAAGKDVAWINSDTNPHVIICPACAPGSIFDSPDNSQTVAPGQIYQFTFSTAGNYDIVLQDNPNVKVSLTVTP